MTASLAIGGSIYILFRDRSHRLFVWAGKAGLGGVVTVLREAAHRDVPALPDWCLYSLPDGLWLFSLLTAVAVIWRHDRETALILQTALVGVTLGHELAQARWPPLGTFSVADVTCYLTAAVLSMMGRRDEDRGDRRRTDGEPRRSRRAITVGRGHVLAAGAGQRDGRVPGELPGRVR